MERVVIVGASLAGVNAAKAIRRSGFDGEVVVLDRQSHSPYDRPPLSKDFLTGDGNEASLALRAANELDVDWWSDSTALGLDVKTQRITVAQAADSQELTYDGLVIANGAEPRALPGVTDGPLLGNVFELRTLDDARAIRAAMFQIGRPSDRMLVCGAGFIGAEVAASARQLGFEVILIDLAEAPLERVLPRDAGMLIAKLHRSHGVDVRLGTGVESVSKSGAELSATLSDGSTEPVDIVVVGIGVIPATDWLASSGLELANGVRVDEQCVAGPNIVAAGDIAMWPNRRFGGKLMRIEQWDNAVEMGAFAGRRLVDVLAGRTTEDVFEPVPWFWSDQFDRKIQLAGVVSETSEIVQGSYTKHRFVEIFAEGSRLCGALAWNRPRHAIMARQLIANGASMAEAREKLAPPPPSAQS